MNIVLMADSTKNELLVNFCIAYRNMLSKHALFSLVNTSSLLESSTELNVFGFSTDYSGGLDQIASRTMYNEMDAVIYLRDTHSSSYEALNPLIRACDYNSIPYATNIAGAEILILAIDRGDLDWRDLLRD
ncbi:MAG: methylglyoxal synthase [Clostridiaceae bacterium]|nr:methylglyoxal synthase [Clostridiaceae bacterium]